MIFGYWKDWFCFQAKGQRVLESQQNATERQQCNCVVSGEQMSMSCFLRSSCSCTALEPDHWGNRWWLRLLHSLSLVFFKIIPYCTLHLANFSRPIFSRFDALCLKFVWWKNDNFQALLKAQKVSPRSELDICSPPTESTNFATRSACLAGGDLSWIEIIDKDIVVHDTFFKYLYK